MHQRRGISQTTFVRDKIVARDPTYDIFIQSNGLRLALSAFRNPLVR